MQPTVMQTQSPTFPVLETQEEKIECFRGLGEFEGTTDFCGRCCSECVAITELVSIDDAAARDTCVCAADMTLTKNQQLYLSDYNDCARPRANRPLGPAPRGRRDGPSVATRRPRDGDAAATTARRRDGDATTRRRGGDATDRPPGRPCSS